MAFPSGHSANAITLGLGLALLLTAPGRARAAAVAAALLFALLVGVSRMVLGVHWPSDVAGGWLLGALWTVLLVRLAAGTGAPRPH
jgi:undecaprenyl-diphosphatase